MKAGYRVARSHEWWSRHHFQIFALTERDDFLFANELFDTFQICFDCRLQRISFRMISRYLLQNFGDNQLFTFAAAEIRVITMVRVHLLVHWLSQLEHFSTHSLK